jgi:hypothetical protein
MRKSRGSRIHSHRIPKYGVPSRVPYKIIKKDKTKPTFGWKMMWKRLFARWRSRGQAMKKHPSTSINVHLHSDDSTDEWNIASSHERSWQREEHKDLAATNDDVTAGQRVGQLVEGSPCSSSQPAKEEHYVYKTSSPPEKAKLHYFWLSTPALQIYVCIFLAIVSRDVRLLHGISLAFGFQMLTVIFKWVRCISQSSDLRDLKKYFLWSMIMPLRQLEQSIEGGAFRRSMENAALVAGFGLTKSMDPWSISRGHMHTLNGSLVTEWKNWVNQEDEMYKSYEQEQETALP